jgi:dolichyl-phosphate-mannose--protein O-mannosyl transferase
MWDGQSRVVGSHPYLSHWTDWALMKRPIWYAYDKEGPSDSQVRGVLLLGNPLVMWSGIIAILICGIDWLKKRRRDAMLIFLSYSAFYLSWSVIPRKVSFYYYYYPAGMTLSLALAYVFHRFETSEKKWFRIAFFGLAAVLFIYFFPILAGLKIPANGFTDYMWLSSWI